MGKWGHELPKEFEIEKKCLEIFLGKQISTFLNSMKIDGFQANFLSLLTLILALCMACLILPEVLFCVVQHCILTRGVHRAAHIEMDKYLSQSIYSYTMSGDAKPA